MFTACLQFQDELKGFSGKFVIMLLLTFFEEVSEWDVLSGLDFVSSS